MLSNLGNWCLAKKNQIHMMYDRGYEINDDELIIMGMNPRQILRYYARLNKRQPTLQKLTEIVSRNYTRIAPREDLCKISYIDEPLSSAAKKDSLGKIVEEMIKEKIFHTIIISSKKISPDFAKGISFMPDFNIEVIILPSLFINPSKNHLTPKMSLTEFDASDHAKLQLPKMKTSDTMSKWYDFRIGDILLIEGETEVSIRMVV